MKQTDTIPFLGICVLLLLVSACATANPRPDYDRTAQRITQATGQKPIYRHDNKLIASVRAGPAVKVFGDDLQQLAAAGNKVVAVLNTIPSAADVKVEQVSGMPMLRVDIDRAAIARFRQNVSDAQGIIEIAMGGKSIREVLQGDRRLTEWRGCPKTYNWTWNSLRGYRFPCRHRSRIQT